MKQEEKEPVDYTGKGIIIFSPIVLVILAVLIYIGCKHCYMPMKSVIILFIFGILGLSAALVSIGVVWYKGFKEPMKCSEEKAGKKRVKVAGDYIGLLVFGTAFFVILGFIIYSTSRDYLAKDAIKVLHDLNPVEFIALSMVGITVFVIWLSAGALVALGIIKYKEMNTITVEEPQDAGERLHQFLALSRNRK